MMLQAALMAFDKMSSSLFLHQNPPTHSVKVFNKAKTLNPKTTTGISMT